ncbi:MAG TPA: RidA family protein [Thermoleophilaceae bacterium]|nr:RidA family protein [Thermoleophilaceae bacterium]
MNLKIELPPPPPAAGSYQLAKRHKDLVFLSGHGPIENGQLITGKVGADLTLEEGVHAARVTGLNLLATLKAEFDELENVVSVLKLLGMINVAPGFDQLPAVMNGASDLMIEVFGEKVGRHARSAVGMAELPFGMAVEIEAVVAVR